jgi:transcriptional regulator with XRE-family HTH domain
MPHPSRPATPFAVYLARLIEMSPKTQRQIATEIGYPKANIITMFKQGTTKVPYEKIPALAEALDVDPVEMLRRAMREYAPETLEAIEDAIGDVLTENERRVIRILRESCPGGVVPAVDGRSEARLRAVFE